MNVATGVIALGGSIAGLIGLYRASGLGSKNTETMSNQTKKPCFKVMCNKRLGDQGRLLRMTVENELPLAAGLGVHYVLRTKTYQVSDFYPFGKNLEGKYWPVQAATKPHVDFVVKGPASDLAEFLSGIRKGAKVEASGPYENADLKSHVEQKIAKGSVSLGVACGGTGAVVGLQALRYLEPHLQQNRATIHLLISDRTESDILYDSEFQRYSKKYPKNVFVHRTLTRQAPNGWKEDVGRISVDKIQKYLPVDKEDAVYLLCGPASFQEHLTTILKKPNVFAL